MQEISPSGTFRRLLRLLCPRCGRGQVFQGWFRMNETCPSCTYRFEREPGYFVGAMYISYALAIPTYATLVLCFRRWVPNGSLLFALLAALPPFLLLVPLIFRYSRISWIYFDRTLNRGS
jgi:uncharacterized protein (DUF983 family)